MASEIAEENIAVRFSRLRFAGGLHDRRPNGCARALARRHVSWRRCDVDKFQRTCRTPCNVRVPDEAFDVIIVREGYHDWSARYDPSRPNELSALASAPDAALNAAGGAVLAGGEIIAAGGGLASAEVVGGVAGLPRSLNSLHLHFERGERLWMLRRQLWELSGQDFDAASRSPRVEGAQHRSMAKGIAPRLTSGVFQ